MKISIDDAVRYMGAREGDASIRRDAERIAEELERKIAPRYTWRVFHTEQREDGVFLPEAGKMLTGTMSKTMLAECGSTVLMACTLGAAFDTMMHSREVRDMAEAVMLDACGSAWVEAGCDEAEKEIAERFPGLYLTDRFSPGYGDLPLSCQEWIPEALNAGKRLGITVNDSYLLIPGKSVTAVIGLSDKPQGARIRGCGACRIRENCAYRKRGSTCVI